MTLALHSFETVDEVEFYFTISCRRCGAESGGPACEDTHTGHVEYVTPRGWLRIGLAVLDGAGRARQHILHFCETCADDDLLGPSLVEATRDLRGLGALRKRPPPTELDRTPDLDDQVDDGAPRQLAPRWAAGGGL